MEPVAGNPDIFVEGLTMSAALEGPDYWLREMLAGDLDAVAIIEKKSYGFPWSRRVLRDCLRANYICRVLESDDALLGYGIMSCGAAEGHILNICVDPSSRTKGLGTMLISSLLENARLIGVKLIYLEVRPSNLSAVKLYKSLEFEQVATRVDYYPTPSGREDALVFSKALND